MLLTGKKDQVINLTKIQYHFHQYIVFNTFMHKKKNRNGIHQNVNRGVSKAVLRSD